MYSRCCSAAPNSNAQCSTIFKHARFPPHKPVPVEPVERNAAVQSPACDTAGPVCCPPFPDTPGPSPPLRAPASVLRPAQPTSCPRAPGQSSGHRLRRPSPAFDRLSHSPRPGLAAPRVCLVSGLSPPPARPQPRSPHCVTLSLPGLAALCSHLPRPALLRQGRDDAVGKRSAKSGRTRLCPHPCPQVLTTVESFMAS